jgi:hypothetical protein
VNSSKYVSYSFGVLPSDDSASSVPCLDPIFGEQTSKYMIASHRMMALKHQVADLVGVLEAEE